MLRHSLGFIIAIVAFPALYFGVAWSADQFEERISAENLSDPALLNAVAVIVAVGLACGLLAGTRVSPLAALISGAALLTVGLWPVINYASLRATLPDWATTTPLLDPIGPVLPMNLVLGTLLFVSALAPSRWKRRPDDPAAEMDGSAPLPPVRDRPEPELAARPAPAQADADPERTTIPFQRD